MAVAGKVAITLSTENGGAWSANVTYDRLVAVKHNNNLYISRKTVANIEPPNNEFWFLALEGFSGDDIEDIIDGTTQVGNARTLDGHEAEYFAPKTDLANYFPLTGGTVTAQHFLPLGLKNASGNNSYIQFEGKDGVLGYLGFESTNVLRLLSSVGGSLGDILHTGNKPTGSYTGNGSSTARQIAVGGIGSVVAVYSNNTVALVGFGGFVGMQGGSVVGKTDAYVADGKLNIANADACLNANGVTYTYQVL